MFEQWQPWWDVVLLLTTTGVGFVLYALANDE
jgi:hypothetical protein